MFDEQGPFDCESAGDAPPWATPVPMARPITIPYACRFHPPAHEILLRRSSRWAALADVGLLIAGTLALTVVAQLALSLCTGGAFFGLAEADTEMMRAQQVPALVLMAMVTFVVVGAILALRRQSLRSVGFGGPWGGLLLDCGIGVGVVIALYVLLFSAGLLVFFFAPGIAAKMSENANRLTEMLPRLSLLEFAGFAMVIGLYEEVLFRGFLMTRLRRVTGGWTWAVLITTVVFTALHAFDQVSVALPMIAVLSLSFSAVTIWRRSIVPAIVAHALFDLSQFVLLSLQMGDSWT